MQQLGYTRQACWRGGFLRAGDNPRRESENSVNSQGIEGLDVLLKPGISRGFRSGDLSLVRPICGQGVMNVDEEEADSEEEEGALQMDGPPLRLEADRDEQVVRKLPDPRLPSQKEVEFHELTHLPYRNWCPVCVRCRGRDLDHRKAVDEERGVSEYAFDYCFPGDEFEFHLVVLVGRERTTGAYFATVVPRKGSSGRFAVDKALDYLHDVGDRASRVIVKTDQEPAIKTWAKDFCEAREDGRTVLEESPVRSSGSNGRAERAVQSVEAQMRVLLLSLEQNLGFKVDAREPILTYLPEYAAHLLNRLEVGKDGKTAYERYKGKKATVLGIHFGEKILYKTRTQAKQNKLRPRWEYGIFVGVKTSSNEI